jgi:hypothetical protein
MAAKTYQLLHSLRDRGFDSSVVITFNGGNEVFAFRGGFFSGETFHFRQSGRRFGPSSWMKA